MTNKTYPPLPEKGQALFLDFDGTLAPLQDDPDTVALVDGVAPLLCELADKLEGALAIISGRDIDDLCKRVPDTLWRLGNHGQNVMAPGSAALTRTDTAPAEVIDGLTALSADYPGTKLENKGSVLALHYRACPEQGEALLAAARQVVGSVEGYSVQGGKMVIEAKPGGANKGLAIREIMRQPPFAGLTPVMAGDDVTDEDGFEAVLDLGGYAVKIGGGESVATYRLSSPEAVADWLEKGTA
ncbi:trehalose-phosphatase [Parvularcula flava]|uniref:Trehalose 6-phosphate phosphatase n=1 Tax=Aquisalinus luteolus TaxID=1566827 RepID=A0A8J3A0C7_9PROT|nr:trehalose-phosphatase [Aquisalinus luteolus]NHK26631.1 trehalose-phosphatase [Aquisalinus luteolus]GGH92931.1 trehalose 6-phosphate phosphatase [Aquisalinus luteolus]